MKLNRKNRLLIGLCTAAGILIIKLFSIQILNEEYKLDARNNSMVYTTIYPTRGIIHDRNGNILVGNKVAYDLMVTPKEVETFDTLALCKVLDITPEFVREKMDEFYRNRRRIGWQSVVMIKQIPSETYMKFAEISYKFPGFRGQAHKWSESDEGLQERSLATAGFSSYASKITSLYMTGEMIEHMLIAKVDRYIVNSKHSFLLLFPKIFD